MLLACFPSLTNNACTCRWFFGYVILFVILMFLSRWLHCCAKAGRGGWILTKLTGLVFAPRLGHLRTSFSLYSMFGDFPASPTNAAVNGLFGWRGGKQKQRCPFKMNSPSKTLTRVRGICRIHECLWVQRAFKLTKVTDHLEVICCIKRGAVSLSQIKPLWRSQVVAFSRCRNVFCSSCRPKLQGMLVFTASILPCTVCLCARRSWNFGHLRNRERCSQWGPVHTGRGAPCKRRKQIMGHTVVNESVHTGCSNIKRFAYKFVRKSAYTSYTSCVNGARELSLTLLNKKPLSCRWPTFSLHLTQFSLCLLPWCPWWMIWHV